MSQGLLDSVWDNREPHHDTLYVNRSAFRTIKAAVSTPGLSTGSVNNVRIDGIDVVPIPDLPFAILCERGQIFTLAKEWKESA